MPAASELTAKPATERMGLLSSSARMQSSARGRLRAAAVSLKPQIKNEKGRIKNESLHPMLIRFRAAACGGRARLQGAAGANSKSKIQNSELQIRDAACGARLRRRGAAGLRCPRLRPAAPSRAQIQNSRFKIQNYKFGTQPAGHACDVEELRASAPGRLRTANRCAIDPGPKSPQPSNQSDRRQMPPGSCSLRIASSGIFPRTTSVLFSYICRRLVK